MKKKCAKWTVFAVVLIHKWLVSIFAKKMFNITKNGDLLHNNSEQKQVFHPFYLKAI